MTLSNLKKIKRSLSSKRQSMKVVKHTVIPLKREVEAPSYRCTCTAESKACAVHWTHTLNAEARH